MLVAATRFRVILRCRAWVSVLCAAQAAMAAPGDIDPSFGVGSGTSGTVAAVVVDDQDRLIVAGSFSSFNGTEAGNILRLNEDGTVDPAFDAGAGANGAIKAVEILPDHRILVGGQFTRFDTTETRGLVLLRPDGSVDPSFTSGFAADGFSVGVTCLEALPGGGIMVGGYFTAYGGQPVGRYALITDTGTLSGPAGAGADSHVLDIDVLPDGKVLLSGFFRSVDGHGSACVARLLSTGAVDPGFSTGTNLGTVAYSVEGQADGKVIVGGSFSTFFGLGKRYLGRLTSTGALDGSYAGNDGPDGNVYGLEIDAEGRLIIAGQFKTFDGEPMTGIGRLLTDGSRDPSFAFGHSVNPSFFQEMPVDRDDRILVYGWWNAFSTAPANLLRLSATAAPREVWLERHFGSPEPIGEAAWDAAPGGDGITNLQKYALGFQGDPREPTRLWGDGGLLFGFRQDESSSGFRFRTDLERTDVHVHAEWSTGLSQWTIEGLEVVEQERNGSRVTWEATLNGAHPAAFFRVRTALSE